MQTHALHASSKCMKFAHKSGGGSSGGHHRHRHRASSNIAVAMQAASLKHCAGPQAVSANHDRENRAANEPTGNGRSKHTQMSIVVVVAKRVVAAVAVVGGANNHSEKQERLAPTTPSGANKPPSPPPQPMQTNHQAPWTYKQAARNALSQDVRGANHKPRRWAFACTRTVGAGTLARSFTRAHL